MIKLYKRQSLPMPIDLWYMDKHWNIEVIVVGSGDEELWMVTRSKSLSSKNNYISNRTWTCLYKNWVNNHWWGCNVLVHQLPHHPHKVILRHVLHLVRPGGHAVVGEPNLYNFERWQFLDIFVDWKNNCKAMSPSLSRRTPQYPCLGNPGAWSWRGSWTSPAPSRF